MYACLATHHKAGTHWTKYVISNYINFVLNGAGADRVDYDEMESMFFPYRLEKIENPEKIKHPLRDLFKEKLDIDALYWSHYESKHANLYKDSLKTAFQCRNALDFIVSKFHYDLKRLNKNKSSGELVINHPWKLHPNITKNWINKINDMNALAVNTPDKFIITSYENLRERTFFEYKKIIEHLFGKVNDDYLKKAIELSSIDNARKDEQLRKKAIVGHSYSIAKDGSLEANSFVRSGEVGQYKKYFEDWQMQEIKEIIINNVDRDVINKLGWHDVFFS